MTVSTVVNLMQVTRRAKEILGMDEEPAMSLQVKRETLLTTKILEKTAVVGAVVALVSIQVGSFKYFFIGGLFAMTNFLGAMSQRKLEHLNGIDVHLKELNGVVDRLDSELGELKSVNRSFRGEREQFNREIKESQIVHDEGKRALSQQKLAYDKEVLKFEKTLNKMGIELKKTEQISQELKEQTNQIEKWATTLGTVEEDFEESLSHLIEERNKFEKNLCSYSEKLTSLESENQRLENVLLQINSEQGEFVDRYEKQVDQLTRENLNLKENIDSFSKGSSSYDQKIKILDEKIRELEIKNREYAQKIAFLDLVKKELTFRGVEWKPTLSSLYDLMKKDPLNFQKAFRVMVDRTQ